MKTLLELVGLFEKSELKSGGGVLALVVGMAVLDTLGVAALLPFLAVVGDPSVINDDPRFIWLYQTSRYLNVYTVKEFIVLLGIFCVATIFLSAAYRMRTDETR